jgi:hypothetical protein
MKIPVDRMIADNQMYKDLMYKQGQVKSPEGMPVNDQFLEQIDILKSFSEVQVDSQILKKYETIYGNHDSYDEHMQVARDSNAMVLLEALAIASMYSDPDDPYDKGFINLLKIIVSLYCGNPYTRDRIGYLMWAIARHISPSCYFPLTLDMYYDPRLWHRPGEYPKQPLPIPPTVAFDGTGTEFGPEDDIWNCDIPDTRSGE